jgi:hypothetical protein
MPKTDLELVERTLPKPSSLFKSKYMDGLLKALEKEATAEIPDVTTPKGRDAIKSIAYKVARSKTKIDNIGKDYVAGIKQEASEVDVVRKQARDFLDDLKAKVRQPLTDWEDAEEARVEKLQDRVNAIKDLGEVQTDDGVYLTVETLNINLEKLRAIKITKTFQEYQEEANNAKNAAMVAVIEAIPKQEEREREAEAQRLQAEQEAEDARIEEEQRIAREAVEAADLESKRELEEIQEREAQEKADQEARERNTRHKAAVNRAAAEGIQAVLKFITDDDAKTLVKAIVKGKIPNVTISY